MSPKRREPKPAQERPKCAMKDCAMKDCAKKVNIQLRPHRCDCSPYPRLCEDCRNLHSVEHAKLAKLKAGT